MAATWIKMGNDLWDHPKIVRVASACNTDRCSVIGALYRLWSIADQHTSDGRLEGYTAEVLDEATGLLGFAEATAAAGWLVIEPEAVVIPEFETHNGRGAKRRSQEALRKQTARVASASDADKKRPREEKRREDTPPPPTPPPKVRTEPEREEEWEAVEEELVELGVNAAGAAIEKGRSRGLTLERARQAVAEFRGHPGAWRPGALFKIIAADLAAWPDPDPAWLSKASRATAAAESARRREMNKADTLARSEEFAEERQLEEQYGPALDALSDDAREALEMAVAQTAAALATWRSAAPGRLRIESLRRLASQRKGVA